MNYLSPDAEAIVLLCSHLGLPRTGAGGTKPLAPVEWRDFAQRIRQSALGRPAALLGRPAEDLHRALGLESILADRIARLLERGGQLAIELERLGSLGVWTMTRADEDYPTRLKARLAGLAPPVLFGAGPRGLLAKEGIAIVGSRDVDVEGLSFAERLAERCSELGLSVVSGFARGVDRAAMQACADAGGMTVGVMADSLERAIRDRSVREHIVGSHLTLITPYQPSAGFTTGAAMGRNKLVYCLSEAAVVVATSGGSGGTWTGAIENLRGSWVPLFVRSANGAPSGNCQLIERGGNPLLDDAVTTVDLRRVLLQVKSDAHNGLNKAGKLIREPSVELAGGNDRELFEIAWTYMSPFLGECRTDKEVAAAFGLELVQVKKWLNKAVMRGLVEKLERPVRYRTATKEPADDIQPSLFPT